MESTIEVIYQIPSNTKDWGGLSIPPTTRTRVYYQLFLAVNTTVTHCFLQVNLQGFTQGLDGVFLSLRSRNPFSNRFISFYFQRKHHRDLTSIFQVVYQLLNKNHNDLEFLVTSCVWEFVVLSPGNNMGKRAPSFPPLPLITSYKLTINKYLAWVCNWWLTNFSIYIQGRFHGFPSKKLHQILRSINSSSPPICN